MDKFFSHAREELTGLPHAWLYGNGREGSRLRRCNIVSRWRPARKLVSDALLYLQEATLWSTLLAEKTWSKVAWVTGLITQPLTRFFCQQSTCKECPRVEPKFEKFQPFWSSQSMCSVLWFKASLGGSQIVYHTNAFCAANPQCFGATVPVFPD